MIKRLISGAQTGVDFCGLVVGKSLGIPTGGTAAPGYLTESGQNIYVHTYYNVEEISEEKQRGMTGKQIYIPRTEENVKNSDGTVYFTTSPKENSGGLRVTRDFCILHSKPYIINPTAERLREWLEYYKIETLNVAGNRASKLTAKQIENIKSLLTEALK